ncbi:beta-lactamase domain-containing protein [Ditylenchus destructor]|uniref:Beta-lactamase domain-containing protein n=1 Tax=Ditylenchus destructor TaxID=166010 RepID=A0AAD4MY62_9BILA|nr:beta-lactamase domain-containing protein [Ditylenchus destructor]
MFVDMVTRPTAHRISSSSSSDGDSLTILIHMRLCAICPLITTTFPVFYFITTTGLSLCPGQISALMTIGLLSITLFNPLTTIACFRCYRQIAIRIVTCGRYDSQNREATVSIQQKVHAVPRLLHSQQAAMLSFFSFIFFSTLFAISKSVALNSDVGGYTSRKFGSVRESFRNLLAKEREGLALAAYVNGELVVDLWDGFADSSASRKWREDTMTCVYAVSKLFGYLVVAKLVSDGRLRYEEKVVKYWPEFGQHGKDVLTVEDLVNHKAGLIGFSEVITIEDVNDLEKLSKIIEQSKPYWKPGSAVGYHATTLGFILDQLVRRVDSKQRTVARFYHDEIRGKETEFYIGLPKEQFHRFARITTPSKNENFLSRFRHPLTQIQAFIVSQFNTENQKLVRVIDNAVPFLSVDKNEIFYNDPDILAIGNIASTGVGSARGVAKAVLEAFNNNIISPEMTQLWSQPTVEVVDIVNGSTILQGHGFLYYPHPVYDKKYLITGVGHGGQVGLIDTENNISIALIRNGHRSSFLETLYDLPSQIIRIALSSE